MKKSIIWIMMMLIIMLVCSNNAWADSWNGFEYNVKADGTVEITSYVGSSDSVVIPASIEGKTVSSIGDWAFEDCSSLHTLTAEDSLTSLTIGSYAFYECDNLTSVEMPTTCVKLQSEAFSSCDQLKTAVMLATDVEDWAFEKCSAMESFTIPSGTLERVTIGSYAFNECSSLKQVSIETPTIVKSEAFSNCTALEKVNFPAISIDDWAFEKCSSIKSVVLGESPNGISIGSYAFYECTGLESFVSIKSKTTIGSEAFSGCSSLKNVAIQSDRIDSWAFEKCSALDELILIDCDSNTTIEDYAFYQCDQLSAAVIPSSVSKISNSAFESCKSVTLYVAAGSIAEAYAKTNSINYSPIDSFISNYDNEDSISTESSGSNQSTATSSDDEWICPNCGNTATGNFCNNCGSKRTDEGRSEPTSSTEPEPTPTPTSKVVATGAQQSGDFSYEFTDDKNVRIVAYTGEDKNVSIPSNIEGYDVVSIGTSAFQDSSTIESLTIWADLQEIGDYAFKGCSSLKSISIPGDTVYLGPGAFEDCTELESVIIWGDLSSINDNAFKNCTSLTSISIPGSATFIGKEAFYNCSDLQSVIIWGDIIFIGESAFEYCSDLQSISIPSSAVAIEDCAFRGCSSLSSLILWGDTNIGNYAFQGCANLSSVSISSGTEYIGDYAFDGCSSLSNVTMWGRDTNIGIGAFDNCPSLSRKPNYPVGNVPQSTTKPEVIITPLPKDTAEPTMAPSPTIRGTATPSVPDTEPATETSASSNEALPKSDYSSGDTLSYEEITNLESLVERSVMMIVFTNDTELPIGRYEIGTEIPAGGYTITATSEYSSPRIIVRVLDQENNELQTFELSNGKSNNLMLEDGQVLYVDDNDSYEIKALLRFSDN